MHQAHLLLAGVVAGLAFAQQPALKPPPSGEERAAMIAAVRQNALDYTARLPDFLCTRVTRRYSGGPKSAMEPAWKLADTLGVRVSFFEQREKYELIRIDDKTLGKPTDRIPGHTTRGEFGSILKDVFNPKTQARFEWERWDNLNGEPVAVISYSIDKAHSTFGTTYSRLIGSGHIIWACKGLIFAGAETHQVARIMLDAVDIPPQNPAQDIHVTVDYGIRKIGGSEYVLPVQSESRMIVAGRFIRAESEFTEYRKFSAETEITYKQ